MVTNLNPNPVQLLSRFQAVGSPYGVRDTLTDLAAAAVSKLQIQMNVETAKKCYTDLRKLQDDISTLLFLDKKFLTIDQDFPLEKRALLIRAACRVVGLAAAIFAYRVSFWVALSIFVVTVVSTHIHGRNKYLGNSPMLWAAASALLFNQEDEIKKNAQKELDCRIEDYKVEIQRLKEAFGQDYEKIQDHLNKLSGNLSEIFPRDRHQEGLIALNTFSKVISLMELIAPKEKSDE